MNSRKHYFRAPINYPESLIRAGKRAMARAFWEYCHDIDAGYKHTDRFYLQSWGMSKTGAGNWMKKFEIELAKFNDFWILENLRVKNLSDQKKTKEKPKSYQDDSLESGDGSVFEENKATKEKLKSDQKKTKGSNSENKKEEKEKEKLALPDCIPLELWNDWVEYRAECKLTNNNKTLLAQGKKLEEWFHAGFDPSEIIKNSILNGWKSLFAPQQSSSGAPSIRRSGQSIPPWVQKKRDEQAEGEAFQEALKAEGFDSIFDYIKQLNEGEGVA